MSDPGALHLPSDGFPTHPDRAWLSPWGFLLALHQSDVLTKICFSWEMRQKGEAIKSEDLALHLLAWVSLNVFEL